MDGRGAAVWPSFTEYIDARTHMEAKEEREGLSLLGRVVVSLVLPAICESEQ